MRCFLPVLCALILFSGCEKLSSPPPVITLSEAHKKFLKTCREEYKIDATITPISNTVWIYVPLDGDIFTLRASPKRQLPENKVFRNWSIHYLGSEFKNRSFDISYDLGISKQYDKNRGYQNNASEEYNQKQRAVLTSVARAYFDVGTVPGDVEYKDPNKDMTHKTLVSSYVKTDQPPEFFVIVYADIRNGIAAKTISYFNDLKQYMLDATAVTQEEYSRRYIYDFLGDEDLIGDKTGEHIKKEAITMPDFLAMQIENRINFKFTRSAFPPSGGIEDEILAIVAEVCRIYGFDDFDSVKLTDLNHDKEYLFDKSQLKTFAREE